MNFASLDYANPDAPRPVVDALLPSNCSDTNLFPNEQTWCKACAAAKTAVACRQTTAYNIQGADQDSCTWIQEDRKGRVARTTAFNLRVNIFPIRALGLKKSTCNVRVSIQKILGQGNQNPTSAGYNAALFDAGGYSPKCGPTYCDLTFTNNGVTLRGYEYKGAYQYKPTNLTDFVLLSATVWTGYQKNLDALATFDDTCAYDDSTQPQCKAAQSLGPFRYLLTTVEEPCGAGRKRYGPQEPSYNKVVKSTVGPWAQFGKVIGPNGGQAVITRFAIQQLTEYSHAKWSVTSDRQRLVSGIVNSTYAASICPDVAGQTCDFLGALKANSVPGSFCFGNKCEGKFVYPNSTIPYSLVTAFPKFQLVDYVNEKETVPTIVRYALFGRTRPGVVVAKKP
jgi:hypothetical protein